MVILNAAYLERRADVVLEAKNNKKILKIDLKISIGKKYYSILSVVQWSSMDVSIQ
jgi:hypothetical protein